MLHIGTVPYPLRVMAKPVGDACNLACRYCYYHDKQHLYGVREHAPMSGSTPRRMSDEILTAFISQYIDCQPGGHAVFVWHGGEPMLAGLPFYRRATELQHRYADGRQISNCLQTNGTMLTPEWCDFLSREGWLVGLSVDGPAPLHDPMRTTADGSPSFQRVLRAIRMLDRHGVQWNAMATVNRHNAEQPDAFYDFFKQIDCRYIQFTPVVERIDPEGNIAVGNQGGTLAPYSVTPEQWGRFLCRVFDRWAAEDVGERFIQFFESTLAGYVGVEPGVCSLSEHCGQGAIIEHNGDVFSCDHMAALPHRLGNIMETPLDKLLTGRQQLLFDRMKTAGLTAECQRCRWLTLCHGECQRNRFALSADGEPGHNYLCTGYRTYFAHAHTTYLHLTKDL